MSFFRWLFPNGIGMRGMLAACLTAALIGVNAYFAYAVIHGGPQSKIVDQIALMLVGALINMVGLALGYFFGSRDSASEAAKPKPAPLPPAPTGGGL